VAKQRKAKRARPKKRRPKGPTLVWSPVAARGNVRKWRLHACGCARQNFPRKPGRKWLGFLELAERYADGEATADELRAGLASYHKARRPKYASGQSGDFTLAFYDDDLLARTWHSAVIDQERRYTPGNRDYQLVLGRFRVLEELIGPDPLPAFDPAWRTSTAVALARGMYESRDFSAMPILADALQDAGCDDDDILNHCRDANGIHVRGCWVVDLVLGKA
jgi:hypothetical protein